MGIYEILVWCSLKLKNGNIRTKKNKKGWQELIFQGFEED
jgi:hypothetical protein